MEVAYRYVIDKQDGKFELESDYPYKPVKETCMWSAAKAKGTVTGVIAIRLGDEEDLANKVEQYGSAAVAIDASHSSFQLYKHGIYDEPQCIAFMLDHGVGCVGWGIEGTMKYWIVKNSWGTEWGEDGYIRMLRKLNQCGIASMACVMLP
jgi:cathepsin L